VLDKAMKPWASGPDEESLVLFVKMVESIVREVDAT
jgi:hypothetical protein